MNGIFPRTTKIMLIRHAEKPLDSPRHYGVKPTGERGKESLSVRGWQRAGALLCLFSCAAGLPESSSLAEPQHLYASKPLKHNGSRRPVETITPLSEKLGIEINFNFPKTAVEAMLEDVFLRGGTVLICWQREYIPKIANLILGDDTSAPQHFPENRFDLVWVFDLDSESNRYDFKQIPQNLLMGDRAAAIEKI